MQARLSKGITVGDGAWLGVRSTILDGVTVGRDAVVGAGSLVRDDVPEGAVVVGVPARVVRYRGDAAAGAARAAEAADGERKEGR
jgi:acetyltransferase-like isoleucine patch superfamily enzyme